MVFDEGTIQKLRSLSLIATKVRTGAIKGDRRSSKRGASVEFADYRDYAPGDELRYLDWNIYARLGKPFIKLFEEEEDLAVHILVDCSKSMDWGEEEQNKFRYALRLAAALGLIALSSGDQLTICCFSAKGVRSKFGPSRGSQQLFRMLTHLETLAPEGETNLNQSLTSYAISTKRPGLVTLISDFFDPNGYQDGFKQLQNRGHEMMLIHLLSSDEVEPVIAGDLRLVDVESGYAQEASIDESIRDLYRQRVTSWRGEIQQYCRKRDNHYLFVSTETPWDRVVLYQLLAEGMVK